MKARARFASALDNPDRLGGGGGDGRRQGGRENEGRRVGSHRIDDRRARRYIAAEGSKALGERALDNVDASHHAVALGDARPARAIEADGVDLIEIGERAIFLREIDNGCDRRHVAVHRIKALENDQRRPAGPARLQKLFEMGDVVVAENLLFAVGALHALDHRIMILRVGQDEAVRQQRSDGGDRGQIGNPARSEDEGGGLGVKIGQLVFEIHQRAAIAGNVARAASPSAVAAGRLLHSGNHLRVTPHAEVVVGAPDDDFLLLNARAIAAPPKRARKANCVALQFGEDPVAPLGAQPIGRLGEKRGIVHPNPVTSLRRPTANI